MDIEMMMMMIMIVMIMMILLASKIEFFLLWPPSTISHSSTRIGVGAFVNTFTRLFASLCFISNAKECPVTFGMHIMCLATSFGMLMLTVDCLAVDCFLTLSTFLPSSRAASRDTFDTVTTPWKFL